MDEHVETVRGAWERTRAAGTARHEYRILDDLTGLEWPRGRVVGPLVRAAWRRVVPGGSLYPIVLVGTIDFAARRYDEGHLIGGRLGERHDAGSDPTSASSAPNALWLVEALACLTSAEPAGTTHVFGTRCRAYDVLVDLSRAPDLAVPERPRFTDLLALPLRVALDDRHVRRVVGVHGVRTVTLSLWDHGGAA